ncbi:YdeI/OmpD-associated family protein [Kribbella sp.]|uniref:YdeI/OmpD-associated family protein n=1 Tax=Kribbella sp. TaxID=1871183 RepID=UPI002D36038E|nr:YdeI/OmpD-associated family protein [Kribbella sp.]HZX01556.1 YdeI/OmpD-associated family protein [Kribbella sp.]
MKFTAELLATGKNTAGFEVPESIVEALGGGGRPKVSATVNGFTFRTSIARMGGRYLLGVSAERRTEAGIAAGDVLDVEVELDTAPRELDVPEPLAAALAADDEAKAFWDTLSYSNRQWHVLQVTSAKTDATRERRIEKSVGMLRERRAR